VNHLKSRQNGETLKKASRPGFNLQGCRASFIFNFSKLFFRKFETLLNPNLRIFYTLQKVLSLLRCLSKLETKKGFHQAIFELQALKAEIKVLLKGCIIAMVTYNTMRMTTWLPMIGIGVTQI